MMPCIPPSLTLPLKGGGDFYRLHNSSSPSPLEGEGGVGGSRSRDRMEEVAR
jgi:hypothetical protein